MGDDEVPEPSAAASEIGPDDEEAGSDQNQEQASTAQTKRRKIQGPTNCYDDYAVSKQREALIAKANTGDFKGLRAVTPVKSNARKPVKNLARMSCMVFFSGSMMTPTTRDMTVRETYAQCIVLSNKVCFEC